MDASAVAEYVDLKLAEQKREFETLLEAQKAEQKAVLEEQKAEQKAVLEEQKAKQKAVLEEQKAKQDAKIATLSEKLQEQATILEEQAAVLENMIDPRLLIWNTGESSSSNTSRSSELIELRRNYRSLINSCMGCGCKTDVQKELSIAHIVANNASINSLFGKDGNYVDDVEVESIKNYLVLCGSHGKEGTCHHEYDCLKMSLYFCKEAQVYKWYTADEVLAERVRERVFTKEDIGYKYARLLNWRTLKTVLQHGKTFTGNSAERAAFINMLKIWEEDECND